MKALRKTLLFLGLAASSTVSVHAAQLATAKVLSTEGTISVFHGDGSAPTQLKAGDILSQGDSISVTALSRAEIVFSNGSELSIPENTSVDFTEMSQEAFAGNKSYEQLDRDPSKSETVLDLNYGKLAGHVKKLQKDSKFHIRSALGTAAIRGTRWSMILRYDADTKTYQVLTNNKDGLVDFISKFNGSFNYGKGNVGEKGYDADSVEKSEPIPPGHKVVLAINENNPLVKRLFGEKSQVLLKHNIVITTKEPKEKEKKKILPPPPPPPATPEVIISEDEPLTTPK